MSYSITFHGGAGGVTGSKHIIEHDGKKIMLDCGMFQGRRSEARELNENLPFEASDIDVVVLSHAHIDHCGLLPLLVKRGFRGHIWSTPATKDVARRMLENSAGLQEGDYYYLQKRRKRSAERYAKPLYTKEDIPPLMRRFKTADYVRNGLNWTEILPGVRLKFYDAGHILGSAASVIELKKGRTTERIVFTGDLGRRNSAILYDPQYIKDNVRTLLSESTYGSRKHHSFKDADAKIIDMVEYICAKKSKLVIPAFSLGRTQEIVYILHHLTDSGQIPRVPIYVDSPLAGRVTDVFRKYRHDYDLESKLDFPRPGDAPLAFRNLRYTESRDESIALNSMQGPLIIISASGMAEGGRVLHHLKHTLRASKNVILFTGYQAEHTLGRRILEGQSPVRIYDRHYRVNARIEVVNELSAHADGNELCDYITHIKGLENVFLVHGEPDRAQQLKAQLKRKAPKLIVAIPKRGETVNL